MQQRQILLYDRSALDQYRGLQYFRLFIDDTRPGLAVILVPVMRRLAGIVLDNDLMPVADQDAHRVRRQCNPVFLESGLFWYADMEWHSLGLYIQGFF